MRYSKLPWLLVAIIAAVMGPIAGLVALAQPALL